MLAKEFRSDLVTGEFYLQPKLNGHRAVWDGKKLWSRNGKHILSVPGLVEELKEHFDGIPLDGELYCHGMSFQEITKIARRTVNIEDNKKLCFHVYDLPVKGLTFAERYTKLSEEYKDNIKSCSRVKLTKTKKYKTLPDNLNVYGDEYEGTMLRNSTGQYKFGKRSADLMKIKKFHDAEATIIGVEQYHTFEKIIVKKGTPGSRKKSDGTASKNGAKTMHPMVGAFVCKLENGTEFKIGSGLNHEERAEFWKNSPIGRKVTFQYQELSSTGVPIFPTYLRMHEEL